LLPVYRTAALGILVHLLVLGCGTSSPASDADATQSVSGDISTTPASCRGEPEAPSPCEAPLDVATADDVYAKITELTEVVDATVMGAFGPALRPSRDLRVQTNLELDTAKLLAMGALCPPSDAGVEELHSCFDWGFTPEKPFYASQSPLGVGPYRGVAKVYPPGISCIALSPKRLADGCDRLAIAAGTVVRFQRVVERDYFGPIDRHYVRVVRACADACNADEVRCVSSTTCVVGGRDYCTLCGGLAPDVCVCRDKCAPKADGTACQYMSSDDTGGGNSCKSGACVQ
jgi:hypothetical protein